MVSHENSGIGLGGSETLKELEELQRKIAETEKRYGEALQKIQQLSSKYGEDVKAKNPYKEVIEAAKKQDEELTVNIGSYKNIYDKRLATDRWYVQEFSKLMENKKNLSQDDQINAVMDLGAVYNEKKAQAEKDIMKKHQKELGSIVADGLSDVVAGYKDFDDVMKDMTRKLYKYLIDEALKWVVTQVSGMNLMSKLPFSFGGKGGEKSPGTGGKFFGTVLNTVKSFFGKFHDGGIVPVGANAQIPGTKEQLAILKGGERILSPGENASYNSNAQSAASPVVFNNFNVKAWDSKDVQKYLLENKQLLNAITFEGIKYNNNHLRTMVQNA